MTPEHSELATKLTRRCRVAPRRRNGAARSAWPPSRPRRRAPTRRKRLGLVGRRRARRGDRRGRSCSRFAGGGDDGASGEERSRRRGDPGARDRRTSPRPRAPPAASCQPAPRSRAATTPARPVKYRTNPPTSGDHDPTPAQDGVYDAGQPAGRRAVRPRARARPDQHPVQAGHARRAGRPARDPLRRGGQGHGRLPHAAVREPDEHGVRGRRDRLGPVAHLPDVERQGLRRDPRVPRSSSSTRARSSSRRPARAGPRVAIGDWSELGGYELEGAVGRGLPADRARGVRRRSPTARR